MGDMQKKILAAIKTTVDAANPELEVVDQPKFANTGNLYVQPKAGFATVLQIQYAFHDTDATIGLSHHALAFAGENGPRDDGRGWKWIKGDNCNGALDGPTFFKLDYTDAEAVKILLDLVKRTAAGEGGVD